MRTQMELIADGFRKLGEIKGFNVFKKTTPANGAFNASKGARGAAVQRGGFVGGRTNIPESHPADILTTDLYMINPVTGEARKFRRSAVVLPQGSSVDWYRGSADSDFQYFAHCSDGNIFIG